MPFNWFQDRVFKCKLKESRFRILIVNTESATSLAATDSGCHWFTVLLKTKAGPVDPTELAPVKIKDCE